ncbi:MAG: hypothetical protein JKY48_05795 [Flavobacteriales bacterium]|nr:hypothetical protein [Flavobacteriales bacterium]
MRRFFTIMLSFIGLSTFGQNIKLDQINKEVDLIESDTTLKKTEFDSGYFPHITTDGGIVLTIWKNGKETHYLS